MAITACIEKVVHLIYCFEYIRHCFCVFIVYACQNIVLNDCCTIYVICFKMYELMFQFLWRTKAKMDWTWTLWFSQCKH